MTTPSQRQHFTQTRGPVVRTGGTQSTRLSSPAASSSAPIRNRIIEDDDSSQRVSAIKGADQPIVGAYRPTHNDYWLLSITPLPASAAGVPFRPDHLPLWSREQARQWIDLVAHLCCSAAQFSRSA
jgi:hypothetical protein